jgi:hypothetical protein
MPREEALNIIKSIKATGNSPVAFSGGQCPRALFPSLARIKEENVENSGHVPRTL